MQQCHIVMRSYENELGSLPATAADALYRDACMHESLSPLTIIIPLARHKIIAKDQPAWSYDEISSGYKQ